jgi:hypothetical protein
VLGQAFDEKEAEGGVVGGELEKVLDRQQVADGLLGHDEIVAAGLVG